MARAVGEQGLDPTTRARGLVQLLLARLDTARNHTDALAIAFITADEDRALAITERLRCVLSDANLVILVLEQLSGCLEVNARAALSHAQLEARLLRIQAWNIFSKWSDHHAPPLLTQKQDVQMTTSGPHLDLDIAASASPELHCSLSRALVTKGFSSVTAFVDSRPLVALPELADELNDPAISWVLLEQTLVVEAEASGTLECCARSLLVRDLRSELPEGWPQGSTESDDEATSPMFRRAGVFHALAMALPESCAPVIQQIRNAMENSSIPAGWQPEGSDDPVLVATFAAHWPSTSTATGACQ